MTFSFIGIPLQEFKFTLFHFYDCSLKTFFPIPSLLYYDDINLYLFPLHPNPRVCISFLERDRKFYEIDEKKWKICIKKDILKFTFHYLVIIPHFTTRLKSLAPTMGGHHPLSTAPCQKIRGTQVADFVSSYIFKVLTIMVQHFT